MGHGKYAAAKKISKPDGKPLSAEYAQSPCLGDWDGDGDYDMILGVIQGPVKLYINEGKMSFVEKGALTVDGKPINAGDGGPCITDWDGDGTLDLLVGDSNGSLTYYKGKTKGALELLKDENATILPAGPQAWSPRKLDPKSPVGFSPAKPGSRVKPWATDWNGDGRLDLLVGDYLSIQQPAPKLTAKQKSELAALKKAQTDRNKRLMPVYQRIEKAALKKMGRTSWQNLTPEDNQKYGEVWMSLTKDDKEYQKLNKEMMDIWAKLQKLEPRSEGTGLVWVYLRK